MREFQDKKAANIMWSSFDFIYIFWYSMTSINDNKIPYWTDFLLTVENILSHDVIAVSSMTALSWILQLSIIASAIFLIVKPNIGKQICIAQTPFRLIFMVPSVSPLLITISFINNYNIALVILLLIISESVKIFTLRNRKN